jgi:hypothetical protein
MSTNDKDRRTYYVCLFVRKKRKLRFLFSDIGTRKMSGVNSVHILDF